MGGVLSTTPRQQLKQENDSENTTQEIGTNVRILISNVDVGRNNFIDFVLFDFVFSDCS